MSGGAAAFRGTRLPVVLIAFIWLFGSVLLPVANGQQNGVIAGNATYDGGRIPYGTLIAISQDGSQEYQSRIEHSRFSLALPGGTYSILARSEPGENGEGGFFLQDGVSVSAGTTTSLAATLARAQAPGVLNGTVSFANGKPAADVGVWVSGPHGRTGSDGSWSAGPLDPGAYMLSFFYDGRVRARKYVVLAPGETSTFQTRLAPGVKSLASSSYAQNAGLIGTARYDQGLYVHYCPTSLSSGTSALSSGTVARVSARATASHTSWAGWPPDQCLKMDKGPWHRRHTIVGINGVHNWLLGGYGTDTIIGGDDGDVIWSDYRPTGGPPFQVSYIHAGNGRNVIYANATRDYIWTGTNPRTVVHSHDDYASGVIHCQNPAIIVYLSVISQRHYKLDGCHHISHYSVGY